jgi:hypothetical protein
LIEICARCAKNAKTIAETARLRGDLTLITGPAPVVTHLLVLTAKRASG